VCRAIKFAKEKALVQEVTSGGGSTLQCVGQARVFFRRFKTIGEERQVKKKEEPQIAPIHTVHWNFQVP
jgi:hypothetical protein